MALDRTTELAIVAGILIALPPVVWVYYHHRHSGLAGRLWRQHQGFVIALMAFCTALWAMAILWVAGRAGVLSPATVEIFASALSAPLAILAIATLMAGAGALVALARRGRN